MCVYCVALCVSMCVSMCTMYVPCLPHLCLVPMEAKRACPIPRVWSFRCLWTAMQCGEALSIHEQDFNRMRNGYSLNSMHSFENSRCWCAEVGLACENRKLGTTTVYTSDVLLCSSFRGSGLGSTRFVRATGLE